MTFLQAQPEASDMKQVRCSWLLYAPWRPDFDGMVHKFCSSLATRFFSTRKICNKTRTKSKLTLLCPVLWMNGKCWKELVLDPHCLIQRENWKLLATKGRMKMRMVVRCVHYFASPFLHEINRLSSRWHNTRWIIPYYISKGQLLT